MRKKLKLFLVGALVMGLLPVAGAARSSSPDCPSAASERPAPLSFKKPVYIDRDKAGGEPVSIVAQDGSIIVSAHAGTTHVYKDPEAAPGGGDFASSYYNQTLNWRSTNGGKTWKYVGTAGQETGPHSPTSTGFSDPDLSMDAGGNIYNVEIDLANVSVFASPDDGQSWPTANPVAASGDRPWVTGAEDDEVFLYVNLPKQLWRSTNGGLVFELVSQNFPATGKLLVDTLNPKTGLVGPSNSGIAISPDDGVTWESYAAPLGRSTQFFGAVAVDRAGWVYVANAGGYAGSSDTTPNGSVSFNYFNRETKKFAAAPINIDIPKGDALWPWIIAGDDGRAAVTWYQTFPDKPDQFFVYVAYTTNAHGSYVTCSDGSKSFVPPQFQVANASGRPIHKGKICLQGTTCNANPSFEGGDRRLGDFFTVNFDHKGNIFIASADTMLRNPLEGPKPVANPIFIGQKGGDRLLVKPDKVRDSRCLFPLPSC